MVSKYLFYDTDKTSVCLPVCLLPNSPLVGFTYFLMEILISYPGVILSIFLDLWSKVKVIKNADVKVKEFLQNTENSMLSIYQITHFDAKTNCVKQKCRGMVDLFLFCYLSYCCPYLNTKFSLYITDWNFGTTTPVKFTIVCTRPDSKRTRVDTGLISIRCLGH